MSKSSKEIFDKDLKELFITRAKDIQQLSTIYKFIITGDNRGVWRLLCVENPSIEEGEGDADCTITLSDHDFIEIIEKRLTPQMAFMSQKMKISGDVTLAMKLNVFL